MNDSGRVLLVLACLTAFLFVPGGALAGDMEDFVCDWLEEDTACTGNQTLSDDFLEGLVAEVEVGVPGCELPVAKGRVQITNNFDYLRVRVEMSGDFANPAQLPDECGTGCGQAGDDCECHASDQGLTEIPPGTTRYVDCAFPTCFGCSSSCDNDPGECPFGDIYCMAPSNIVIELREVSCDGGTNWTTLGARQIVDLDWSLVTACE